MPFMPGHAPEEVLERKNNIKLYVRHVLHDGCL